MKRRLVLRRFVKDEECCLGQLEDADGSILCGATLEHPYRDEDHDGFTDHDTSCIPAGVYDLLLRVSKKNGGDGGHDYDVPQLRGVPHRDVVQMHRGNTLKDTRGCILVGTSRAKSADEPMILGSEAAHKKMMASIYDDLKAGRCELEVLDP